MDDGGRDGKLIVWCTDVNSEKNGHAYVFKSKKNSEQWQMTS